MQKIGSEFERRFWAKVRKSDGCWNWIASVAGRGYGQIKIPGTRRQEYAHRVAYILAHGEIPAGKSVCHRCDNLLCCNPDHLWLGSTAQNQKDMARKDRSLFGGRNAQAKLTENQARQIHACIAAGMTQKQIGVAFGISQAQVSRIHRGTRWERVRA